MEITEILVRSTPSTRWWWIRWPPPWLPRSEIECDMGDAQWAPGPPHVQALRKLTSAISKSMNLGDLHHQIRHKIGDVGNPETTTAATL